MLPWLRKLDEDGSAPTDCRNDFAVWVERWKWKSDWRGLKNRWGQGSESVCVGNFPEVSLWRRLERYGVMNRIWRCLYVFPAGCISTCLLKNPGGAQLNSLFFWLVINIGLIKIWLSDWSDLIKIQIKPKVSLRCDQFSRENKDLHISESLSSVSEGSCRTLSGYTYFD